MRRSSDPPRRPARGATASASEDELTRDNPKGRLWELCAKRRFPHPEIRHSPVGPRHRVEMRLLLDEWELETGVVWGSSRRVAEQLAARALLAELDALEHDEPSARPTPARDEPELGDDVFDADADAMRLRQSNPKGQVYEWCQKQKPPVRRPRFEERRVKGGGHLVRGHLDTLELHSPWFRAKRRKEAERAAAEALLGLLPVADGAAEDADPIATANPRTLLNELVVHGLIEDCAVEVTGGTGEEGPGRFVAEGRATLLDGSVVRGEPAGGAKKREAITGASGSLLARLRELGVGVAE